MISNCFIKGGFMIKSYLLSVILSVSMPFALLADWVSVNDNKTSESAPQVQILSDDDNSTVLKIDLTGFGLTELLSGDKTYQAIDLLTEMFTNEAGNPQLPYLAKVLAIPDQSGVSVEVIETGEIQVFKNIYLPPARTSWIEGQPEAPYAENADIYQLDELFPAELVKIDPPGVFRDFRIARVSVYPLRYNPAKRELEAVSSITVRINYTQGKVINPKTTQKRPIASSFGELYRSFIFNYQSVLDKEYNGKEEGHELMLCIMPDELFASFQIYADWKRQSGTDIHLTKFSDIGANATNPDIIKNHISDAYFNWEVPPTYVLIIGDDLVFPKKIVTYPNYSFPNEDFFVEVEGNDYFPEMMIGRFTNQGDYRMQVMISKFLKYEKTPYTANTDWFKKGVVCSNNYYDSQVITKRFTADIMLEYGQFTSVDTLMSDGNGWGGGCTYDLNDVINSINNGRSWLNYRGEGWYDGWQASCYQFLVSDVSNLNNGEKFTFVTSIGCGVAGFQASGGNCFGEEWVEMGTLTNSRGAVAFIGPTSNTHTTYNNKIDKGIYEGMFLEGMDTPGQALLRGKLYMYNVFGNEYYVEYHYKIYCVLGDPSIHIWKDIPLAVNCSHPSTVSVGSNLVGFTVTFASNGQPVANAEVCVTGDDVFITGITDATGSVVLGFVPLAPETLVVTVRGGNVIPYQGNITVVQENILIEPQGDPVIIDNDGNTDGLINPNEHCSVTYTLKNWGSQAAGNVQATLSTEDTEFIQILTTGPVSFGTIAPNGTSSGNPFQLFVEPDCPIGTIATLKLHVTTSSYTWDYYYDIEVVGCLLDYQNYVVFDGGTGNLNFRMDPGEHVVLVLSLKNIGMDAAPGVMGILSSDDPYITVVDSIGSFGMMNINNTAVNMDNFYIVHVSSSCPTGYLADYTIKAYTENGNYPYQVLENFQIPVSLPVPTDFTGPDAYGYYAYSSEDSFFEQTPGYNWFELVGIGTYITLPEISDYTQTINLPFDFTYYGQDFDQVRISTDGWMAFGSGTQVAPLNTPLPNVDNISSMVAVFWDDLYDIEFFLGNILYYYDSPNHRFIIEWDSLSINNFVGEPTKEIFQAILLDPAYYPTASGNGEMIFQYKQVEETEFNTIGIENVSQSIGLQYVFNNNYPQTASTLLSETAIKITTEPPFSTIITTSTEEELNPYGLTSSGYQLGQNHPNPFSSSTWINYILPKQNLVKLSIYNVNGAIVRTLHDGTQLAGTHSIEWNGLNNDGNQAAPGIYFYRLQSENYIGTKKMFLMK